MVDMQPTPEELELRARVTQTLTTQGVLDKIKAQLRAAVFHAMQAHEPDAELASTSRKLEAFGSAGALALDVVADFLAFFQLHHSLAVLQTEANVDTAAVATQRGLQTLRSELSEMTAESSDAPSPLLIQLLLLHKPRSQETQDRSAALPESSSSASRWRPDDDAVPGAGDDALRGDSVVTEPRWLPTATTLLAHLEAHHDERNADERDDADDRSEDEMADVSVASEMSESIAEEEQSAAYNQDYEIASRDEHSVAAGDESKRLGRLDEPPLAQEEDDDAAADDDVAAALSPPPAPTSIAATAARETTDEDEFDEELEAARLSSLDAKLQAMEAEDETGTLQQLKATLLRGDDGDNAPKKPASAGSDNGDAYGSDFEEDEVSDDEIGSVSDLPSEPDESASSSSAFATAPAAQRSLLDADRAVDDENALNSYDYIEQVEPGGS